MIVRVSLVLNRTVVDRDRLFDKLCGMSPSESKIIIYFIYDNSQITDWSAICVKAQNQWKTACKKLRLDAAKKDKQSAASLPLNWSCKERKSWCIERDAKLKWPVKRKTICTARPVGLMTPANFIAVKEICVMLAHLLLSALCPSSHALCCIFFTSRTVLYGNTNGYVPAARNLQAITLKNNLAPHI